MRCKNITTRCGAMLSLGMRLPRKSWDKTRTLHACVLCVLCDLINLLCENMHNMNYVLLLFVCLVIST